MATSEFMATTVIDAVTRRIAEAEERCLRKKAEFISRAMSLPIKRGPWPFRYSHYRTEAEASALYSADNGWARSPQYWDEYEKACRLDRLLPIKALCEAALRQWKGAPARVTLTDGEAGRIGLLAHFDANKE